MSKKIELTQEQINECLRLYNEELLGSTSISEQMGFHKTIIIRTLKENGVEMGPSGRRNIGGKAVAQKKYESKPEIKNKRSEFHKEWSKENRKELRKYHAEWREENKEHVNKYKRDYERNRRREDPKYRLGVRTRTALWTCLKEANVAKYRRTFDLLGYSIEELMSHLENLFTEGMTWDNYGEWHVDHMTNNKIVYVITSFYDSSKEKVNVSRNNEIGKLETNQFKAIELIGVETNNCQYNKDTGCLEVKE